MYLDMNWLLSVRAFSTFRTNSLVRSSAACCFGSCARIEVRRRSKSSADPPHGLNRIKAAAMFKTSSVPRAARTLTRGSFSDARLRRRRGGVAATKLKLLGIVHVHRESGQRIGLRRRETARYRRMYE